MQNNVNKEEHTNTIVEAYNTKESYRTGHREQVAQHFNERTTDIYAKMALRQRELYKECEKALDKFHDHLENHKHILADNARVNAIEKLDSVSNGSLTEEAVRDYMLYLDNELEKYHRKMELQHNDSEETPLVNINAEDEAETRTIQEIDTDEGGQVSEFHSECEEKTERIIVLREPEMNDSKDHCKDKVIEVPKDDDDDEFRRYSLQYHSHEYDKERSRVNTKITLASSISLLKKENMVLNLPDTIIFQHP